MDAKKLQYFTKKILDERDRITASLTHHEVEFEGTTSSRSAEFEEASRVDRDREYISGLLTMDTESFRILTKRLSAFSTALTASAWIAVMISRRRVWRPCQARCAASNAKGKTSFVRNFPKTQPHSHHFEWRLHL